MSKELFMPYDNRTPEFSLAHKCTYARVTGVHDGDTLTCVIPIFNEFYKFSIRLDGIDTCEISSDNPTNKLMATRARNRLINLVSNGSSDQIDQQHLDNRRDVCNFFDKDVYLIWLECGNFDKYGRLLARARLHPEHQQSFSDILISERLAYQYDGGKKLTELQQIDKLV
jgi:endonuclease YncB( thermonuclease family)